MNRIQLSLIVIIISMFMATAIIVWQVSGLTTYGKSWRTVAGPWVVHKDAPHYFSDVFHVTTAEWRISWSANATTYPYQGTLDMKIFEYYSDTIVKEVDVPVHGQHNSGYVYMNLKSGFYLDFTMLGDTIFWHASVEEYR